MGTIKTVLVTGASGFLGSHLLELLIEANYTVIIIARKQTSDFRIAHFNGRYKRYNISPDFNYDLIFQENRVDAIIHLATSYGRNCSYSEVLETNVVMPLKLLEAGVRFNCSIFINTDTFIANKGSKYDYLNTYVATKLMFKDILYTFKEQIKCVSMKLEHMYGERDSDTKFVTAIIREIISNKPEINLTKGTQKRDFIYVKDVAAAYLTVLEQNEKLTSFNEFDVGSGNSFSIKEFVETAKSIANSSSKLNFGALPTRTGEFEESRADIQGLENLGWKPEFTLQAGIIRTLDYEKNNIQN